MKEILLTQVDNRQCLICKLSFQNIVPPADSNWNSITSVCLAYLSPELLSEDIFENIDLIPQSSLTLFCPECLQGVHTLIELNNNLLNIQQEILNFVDLFSREAFSRRNIIEVKPEEEYEGSNFSGIQCLIFPEDEIFDDETDYDLQDSNSIEPYDDNAGTTESNQLCASVSQPSMKTIPLKELSICLERIDSIKGPMLNINSNIADSDDNGNFTITDYDEPEDVEEELSNAPTKLNELTEIKTKQNVLYDLCKVKEFRLVLERIQVNNAVNDDIDGNYMIPPAICNLSEAYSEDLIEEKLEVKVEILGESLKIEINEIELSDNQCDEDGGTLENYDGDRNDDDDKIDKSHVLRSSEPEILTRSFDLETDGHPDNRFVKDKSSHVAPEEVPELSQSGRRKKQAASKANSKMLHFSKLDSQPKNGKTIEEGDLYDDATKVEILNESLKIEIHEIELLDNQCDKNEERFEKYEGDQSNDTIDSNFHGTNSSGPEMFTRPFEPQVEENLDSSVEETTASGSYADTEGVPEFSRSGRRKRVAAVKANSKILHFSKHEGLSKNGRTMENDDLYLEESEVDDDECDDDDDTTSENEEIAVLNEDSSESDQHSQSEGGKKRVTKHHRKIHKRTSLQQCEICLKRFSSPRDLEVHFSIHEKEEPYKCQVCHESFGKYSKNFQRHIRGSQCLVNGGNMEAKKYKCTNCEESFNAQYLLLRHRAVTHKKRCELCGTKARCTLWNYDHFLQHTGEVACACDICGKPLFRFKELELHRLSHTGTVFELFECIHSGCKKGYKEEKSLLNHVKIHHSTAPRNNFKRQESIGPKMAVVNVEELHSAQEISPECPVCNQKFQNLQAYVIHMRDSLCALIPNEGKTVKEDFKCSKCSTKFKAKYLLMRHNVNKHKTKCEGCQKMLKPHVAGKYDHFVKHTGEIPCYCDICGKPMKLFSEFRSHRLSHSVRQLISCEYEDCQKEFKTNEGYRNHLFVDHGDCKGKEAFKCAICERNFSRNSYLKYHIKISHSGKKQPKHKCTVCEMLLTTPSGLRLHMQRHTGYPCALCDIKFTSGKLLRAHANFAHWKKPRKYSCDVCGKNLINRHSKEDHMRLHTGEKPFQCETCGECFPSAGHLNNHTPKHEGKTFLCHICSKSFFGKGELKLHILSHSSDKKHKCDVCDKRFLHFGNFRTHMKTHTGEKPYQCHQCGKSFSRSDNFNNHVKMHMKDKQGPHKCEKCGDSFANKKNLSAHIKGLHNSTVTPKKAKLNDEQESDAHSSADDEYYDEDMSS